MPTTPSISNVIALLGTALADANLLAAPTPPVPVEDSVPPDVDWLEGSPAALDILGHFSTSPAGKTLSLVAGGPLPPGVTIAGGSLVYDGSGSFRTQVSIPLDVTAS